MSLLRAAPLARDEIPAVGTPQYDAFARKLTAQAFDFARRADRVPKRLQLGKEGADGAVYCGTFRGATPEPSSRVRRVKWHTRESLHDVAKSGVTFDTFEQRLLRDHTVQEKEYIEPLERVECIEELGKSAAIWRCSYKMLFMVANRDFVELVMLLALPPSAQPFSEEHERETLAWPELFDGVAPRAPRAGEHRCFIVISQPIAHADARAGATGYLRAYYSSVETVTEMGDATRWIMACQTDSMGWVPLAMQEHLMPSKVVEDVPSFIPWAAKHPAV